MTDVPEMRPRLDPSEMRPLSRPDLERIYGSQLLSFYSPVRPRRAVTDVPEAAEHSPEHEATKENT